MKPIVPQHPNKLLYPRIIRDFTPEEDKFMKDFPFRNKTYEKSSKQSKEHMKLLVSLIEINLKDKNGYVHIPKKYLGKMFKSVQMAMYIIDCAIQKNEWGVDVGIIETDGKYNKDKGISKGYKLTDEFRNIRVLNNVMVKINKKKEKKLQNIRLDLEIQQLIEEMEAI